MNYEYNYELNRAYRKQMEHTAHKRQMVSMFAKPTQVASHFYSRLMMVVSVVTAFVLGLA